MANVTLTIQLANFHVHVSPLLRIYIVETNHDSSEWCYNRTSFLAVGIPRVQPLLSISGIATWCVPKRRGTIDSKTRDCVKLCKRLEHYVCSALWFPVRRFSRLSAFSSSGKQCAFVTSSSLQGIFGSDATVPTLSYRHCLVYLRVLISNMSSSQVRFAQRYKPRHDR